MKLRTKTTPNPDSMDGQFHAKETFTAKVTVTGDETVTLWVVPTDIFITDVITWVETALDGTTPLINVGSDSESDPDNFCDAADGSTVNTIVRASQTLIPGGLHFPSGGNVYAKVSSDSDDNTEGVFVVVIEFYRLSENLASPNYSVTVS